MDKRIESYLDSVIPEKLSKRRQKLIREELRDHISDHIDFYTEIGYSEDESIQKALADMGDDGGVTSMVKKDFERVYGEKIWMPILAFVLTILVIFTAVSCGIFVTMVESKGSPQAYEVFCELCYCVRYVTCFGGDLQKGLEKDTARDGNSPPAVRSNRSLQRIFSACDICARLRYLLYA